MQPPASRRAWSLLAYLALHPGPHRRADVAARFWPDVLDASARQSLRHAVWALRTSLGPAARMIGTSRDELALDAGDGVWVDAREVERLLADGRSEDALALDAGGQVARRRPCSQRPGQSAARPVGARRGASVDRELRRTRRGAAVSRARACSPRRSARNARAAHARVQGLIAAARGDTSVAARRLDEAAAGWRRVLDRTRDGERYTSSFADLARPPVLGLVEPERELDRVLSELANLETTPISSRSPDA